MTMNINAKMDEILRQQSLCSLDEEGEKRFDMLDKEYLRLKDVKLDSFEKKIFCKKLLTE